MQSFFPVSEDYLPPPHARRVKPYHSNVGDTLERWRYKFTSRRSLGLALVTAAIIGVFIMSHSVLAAQNHSLHGANTHPTATPCAAINCNPWGFTFSKGRKISHPPTLFCRYFHCIANFARGTGYVEECRDGAYSKSGGRSGSCADHHGNWRPLLGP